MRKSTAALFPVAALLVLGALVSACTCGGAKKYADGVYYASAAAFQNGWKDFVILTVKGGKIVSADWDGVSEKSQAFKVDESKAGRYQMTGSKAPWHEQAALAEAYLIKTQDPAAMTYKDDAGHTDAISGASISVKEFFDLAQKALSGTPASAAGKAAVSYKDGAYHTQGDAFDPKSGFKDYVEVFVKDGRIVFIRWNAFTAQGADKKGAVARGQYKMPNEKLTWTQQSEAVCDYLVQTQDPFSPPKFDAAGHLASPAPDAVSGATVSVKACFDLVAAALKDAKK